MTKEEAHKWVREHGEEDELTSEAELVSAFEAIFGHTPTAEDWEDDLWSN